MENSSPWKPQHTGDGSLTFFSEEFGEPFHSLEGAKHEAFQKFAQATQLTSIANQPTVVLLDICYGLGYNTAAALETLWSVNPDCHVTVYGLELDASVPIAAIAPSLINIWTPKVQECLRAIAHHHTCHTPQLEATLLIGDARQTIQPLIKQNVKAHAIFFDPFSPRRCPQLWTVEFFRQVSYCLAPNGRLATYSRSASVRSAMQQAGLAVGTIPLSQPRRPHEWSQGTVAAFNTTALHPLSPMEQEHLQTRAAVPLRDPALQDTAEVILQRHHQEQQTCHKESTTQWRKRWGIQPQ